MNIKNKLKIVSLSDIKPYKNNVKLHVPAQIELIKKSLKDHDYYSPIGISSKNEIVFGHGRYQALMELDSKQKIEVVDLSYLKPKQIRKLRILDNKIVSDDYDKELLQAEIEALYGDLDEELEKVTNELGIDEKELNELMPDKETEGDDDIPEEVKTITKMGDLWELGKHKVLCGDATKEEDVNRLMDGKKADMVFTDPPYEISIKSNIIEEIILNGNVFIFQNDRETVKYLKKSNLDFVKFFVFYHGSVAIPQEGGKEPFLTHILITHEKKGKAVKLQTKEGLRSVIKTKYRHEREVHKHLKCVDSLEGIIKGYSECENIIIDLFLGSGSTLIACEKTNRICYGLELDPHYCDVIRDRYIDYCLKNGINPIVKRNGKDYKIAK